MDTLTVLQANLLSPLVLAFVLGAAATLVRSDLRLPEPLYQSLAIYLLLAIGLKGGVALSQTPADVFARPALATLGLGLVTPLFAFAALRRLGGMDAANAAALAAHYGSVSAVTFIAAQDFVAAAGTAGEAFMPALVAILEVPAILVALMLVQGGAWQVALREVLSGRSIVLLLGGLLIGYAIGPAGFAPVEPFFVGGFKGALTLFLLEMGLVAARRLRDLRQVGFTLLGFGLLAPLAHGALGVYLGWLAGLSTGGCAVLGAMAASASYIAAPAAVRLALPQANPAYYLTASLGITFPFNLTLGIPLYLAQARWLSA